MQGQEIDREVVQASPNVHKKNHNKQLHPKLSPAQLVMLYYIHWQCEFCQQNNKNNKNIENIVSYENSLSISFARKVLKVHEEHGHGQFFPWPSCFFQWIEIIFPEMPMLAHLIWIMLWPYVQWMCVRTRFRIFRSR